MIARSVHLIRRGIRALGPCRPLTDGELLDVETILGRDLCVLFGCLDARDQRHSYEVLQLVREGAARPPVEILQAALLHDIGKSVVMIGVVGRVIATVSKPILGRRPVGLDETRRRKAGSVAFPTRWWASIRGYQSYSAYGRRLLLDVAPDVHPYVAAWSEEHHRPPSDWTIPVEWGWLLTDADDAALG